MGRGQYRRTMTYENIPIPFSTIGNVQCLTQKQLVEEPWLLEFIERFPNCFEYDPLREIYRFYPNGVDGP